MKGIGAIVVTVLLLAVSGCAGAVPLQTSSLPVNSIEPSASAPADESPTPGLEFLSAEQFHTDLPGQTVGMTFCSSGGMYVATCGNIVEKNILRVLPNGKFTTLATLKCFAVQYLKAYNGLIYAAVVIERDQPAQVISIASDGTQTVVAEGFIQPVALAFDFNGNLYVTDAMAHKVFRIEQGKDKAVFIDLSVEAVSASNLYHGMAFDNSCKNLYLAGVTVGSGKGNLLKYPVEDGKAGSPKVVAEANALHVALDSNDNVYATVDSGALLVIGKDDKLIETRTDPLLKDGMFLSFGNNAFGVNTLYINTFDKIVKLGHEE